MTEAMKKIDSYIDENFVAIAEEVLAGMSLEEDEDGKWMNIPTISLYAWHNTETDEWEVSTYDDNDDEWELMAERKWVEQDRRVAEVVDDLQKWSKVRIYGE